METHSIDSTESDKSLKHELGLIYLCLHGSVVSSLSLKWEMGGFETNFLQKYLTNSIDSTEFIGRKKSNEFFVKHSEILF